MNKQRGMLTRISENDFEQMTTADSALFVGSPEFIIEKILTQYELFGHKRVMLQLDIGGQPFEQVAKGIELLVTKVTQVIRKETSK